MSKCQECESEILWKQTVSGKNIPIAYVGPGNGNVSMSMDGKVSVNVPNGNYLVHLTGQCPLIDFVVPAKREAVPGEPCKACGKSIQLRKFAGQKQVVAVERLGDRRGWLEIDIAGHLVKVGQGKGSWVQHSAVCKRINVLRNRHKSQKPDSSYEFDVKRPKNVMQALGIAAPKEKKPPIIMGKKAKKTKPTFWDRLETQNRE